MLIEELELAERAMRVLMQKSKDSNTFWFWEARKALVWRLIGAHNHNPISWGQLESKMQELRNAK